MSAKEAPTLYPTEEQFNDPIGYLNSSEILKLGLKYGILKICPPKSYKPPFCLDLDNFKFHTRLQKLSELDLLNRSRKFWLTGFNNFLKTKTLSLDFNNGDDDDEDELNGYITLKDGNLIHLYDVFIDEDIKLLPLVSKKDQSIFNSVFEYKNTLNPLLNKDTTKEKNFLKDPLDFSNLYKAKNHHYKTSCEICNGKDHPETILLCDGKDCNKLFHMKCLNPPLKSIPKSDWICNDCLKGSNNDYGFEEDFDSIFTITDFKNHCDKFQLNYFKNNLKINTNSSLPSINLLEKEFWRLVTDEDYNKDLEVRYGADIHNTKPNEISGFPMKINPNLSEFDLKLSNHPFNLPNLPFAKGSLLNYINNTEDEIISGMTVPWIYIGSMFSTFCWHKEDHYTLSANYCHIGSTKKWYGIPSNNCDLFEKIFKNVSPDYFQKQPDLLHQLVSLLSPMELIDIAKTKFNKNLDIYYLDQNPNEFIITYPKVYHAGFNCGFNINEAVNFTMPSWIHQGSIAIDDYKLVKRDNVFKHYQLLLNILNEFYDFSSSSSSSLPLSSKSYKNMIKTSFVDLCFELGKYNKLLDLKTQKLIQSFNTLTPIETIEINSNNNTHNTRMRFKNVNQKKMQNSKKDKHDDDDDEDERLCHECRTSLNFIWFEIDTLKELLERQDEKFEKEREARRSSIIGYEQLPLNYKEGGMIMNLVNEQRTPILKQNGYDLPTPETSPISIDLTINDRESEFQKIIHEAMKLAKEDSSSPSPPLKRLRSTNNNNNNNKEELINKDDVRKSKRLATRTTKSNESSPIKSKRLKLKEEEEEEETDPVKIINLARDEQVLTRARNKRLKNEKFGKHLLCLSDFKRLYLDKLNDNDEESLKRLKNITTVYKERDILKLTEFIVRDVQPKVLTLLQ